MVIYIRGFSAGVCPVSSSQFGRKQHLYQLHVAHSYMYSWSDVDPFYLLCTCKTGVLLVSCLFIFFLSDLLRSFNSLGAKVVSPVISSLCPTNYFVLVNGGCSVSSCICIVELCISCVDSYHLNICIDVAVAATLSIFNTAMKCMPKFKAKGGTLRENLAMQNVQVVYEVSLHFYVRLVPR